MPYRWILFDADGTLFDYDRAEAAAMRQSWCDFALPDRPTVGAEFRAINADLWPRYARGEITQEFLRVERFRRLLDGTGEDPERFSEHYLIQLGENAQLLAGAAELLQTLHGEVGMALVTNGVADVQNRRLDKSGLRPLFDAVVISSEIGHAKPHAGFFDAVFARIGNQRREEVLMVGDNLDVDIKGGADYGLDTCWINPDGRPRPDEMRIDHEVRAVSELAALLAL